MDKPVVKELIQNDLTVTNLVKELDIILHDETKIKEMRQDYSDLKNLLQKESNASARAAQEIVGFLQSNA